MRPVITLALVGLLGHAAWRITPVYWHYLQFRDGVREIAQFSGGISEREVHERVMALALELQVPVAPDRVSVRREAARTFVEVQYTEPLYLLPRTPYPWDFTVSVNVWHVRPPTLSDIVPKGQG